jgi:CheY-like chemotaxis protein
MDRNIVTILVVDEDAMVRRVLETMLERDGFSVLSTRNSDTALQLMSAASVDLVLMDLPKGERDRTEPAATIRRQFPDVKVVVMSGFFGTNTPPASRLRAHGCLAKPIRPEILRHTVQALLAQHVIPLVAVH